MGISLIEATTATWCGQAPHQLLCPCLLLALKNLSNVWTTPNPFHDSLSWIDVTPSQQGQWDRMTMECLFPNKTQSGSSFTPMSDVGKCPSASSKRAAQSCLLKQWLGQTLPWVRYLGTSPRILFTLLCLALSSAEASLPSWVTLDLELSLCLCIRPTNANAPPLWMEREQPRRSWCQLPVLSPAFLFLPSNFHASSIFSR